MEETIQTEVYQNESPGFAGNEESVMVDVDLSATAVMRAKVRVKIPVTPDMSKDDILEAAETAARAFGESGDTLWEYDYTEDNSVVIDDSGISAISPAAKKFQGVS